MRLVQGKYLDTAGAERIFRWRWCRENTLDEADAGKIFRMRLVHGKYLR
jgi:hypothetical protein